MTLRAWLIAARPPTLLAAISPVLVGAGLAAADDVWKPGPFTATAAAAIAINIAANFANDVSDAGRGADGADRIGPPRAVAGGLLSPRQMWIGVGVAVAVAVVLGIYLAVVSSWVILVIGAASILAMLGYTGGPWPYGYKALGELFVFVFFGLVAVVGSRFVYDTTIPSEAWLLAVPVGFLVTAILVANNVRDIDTDRRSGKRTLAVVLGRSSTRALYVSLLLGSFAAITLFVAVDRLPAGSLLALAAIPVALPPIRTVVTTNDGPALVSALKATAALHALVGALLAIGVQL